VGALPEEDLHQGVTELQDGNLLNELSLDITRWPELIENERAAFHGFC
jgi:hypothetical protein